MSKDDSSISVLFVCMGNICRSPTAEGVFRKLVLDAGLENKIESDSAGTHAYHTGEQPDRRARAAAERRGFSLDGIHARRVTAADFEQYDYIMAMDEDNLAALQDASPESPGGTVALFLNYAESTHLREVPDPYYGGTSGFERVLDLVEEAASGLLDTIRKNF
jgi:protein-tyrosine phosphatase